MTTRRLFLVRHATHGLVDKALAGRMPGVHLSAEGRAQADRLADRFAGEPVGAVLSSPMERCQQTAEPVAARLGLAVETAEDLNEIHCGAWTGQSFEALRDDPRWHAWNSDRVGSRIPDGEGAADAQARAMALVERLAAQGGPPAVLVTHSDLIKCVALRLLDASLDLYGRLQIDPASITTLDMWEGGGKLVRLNEAGA